MRKQTSHSRYRPGSYNDLSITEENLGAVLGLRLQFTDFAIREARKSLTVRNRRTFDAVPRVMQAQYVAGSLKMEDLRDWVRRDTVQKRLQKIERDGFYAR